jgi:hypothetical protein
LVAASLIGAKRQNPSMKRMPVSGRSEIIRHSALINSTTSMAPDWRHL